MKRPNFQGFHVENTSRIVEVFRSRVGTFFDASEEMELLAYLDALAHPEKHSEYIEFWTVRLDERLVGFGGIEVLNAYGYLCWGTIDEAYSGRGLGRALLEHRLNAARAVGARSVFSDTTPQAEGFYGKHGFETFHRAPRYWGGTIDLAAMEFSFDGERRGPRRVDATGQLTYQPMS